MWAWLLGGGNAASPAARTGSNSFGFGGAPLSVSVGAAFGPTSRSRFTALLSGDFTLANMQMLHAHLARYAELPDADVVELLRVLSEFLIYSDQNRVDSPSSPRVETSDFAATSGTAGVFFDYFCEKNILALLCELGAASPSPVVQVQLLQTLSLLVQNIATPTSLYYLLSNNYVNRILECPFAVDTDDDVRDWFVTLLKALSLRLNQETVQFFFNAVDDSFPLYAKALRFGRCNETMIQVAVKTLTLNVLKVPDDRVRRFILSHDKMAYFRDVVDRTTELALKIQGLLNVWMPSSIAVTDRLEEAIEAYIDHCFYLQDVLDVKIPELSYKVGHMLFKKHVRGFLAASILPNCHPPPQRVCTRLALYLLTRLMGIMEHTPLVNAIAYMYVASRLLSPDAPENCKYSAVAYGDAGGRKPPQLIHTGTKRNGKASRYRIVFQPHSTGKCSTALCYLQTRYAEGEWPFEEVEAFVREDGNCFRQSLVSLIESSDELLSSTSLLLVLAVMNCGAVDPALLRDLELLPLRVHLYNKTPATALKTAASSQLIEGSEAPSEPSQVAMGTSDSSTDGALSIKTTPDDKPRQLPHWLFASVMRQMARCSDFRIVSTHLAARIVLDLVWDGHSATASGLPIEFVDSLRAIHSVSTHSVMQSMRGAMSDVDLFVGTLEDELEDFRRGVFPIQLQLKNSSPAEFLVQLTSPGSDLVAQKATLTYRSPCNEMEVCRKSVRVFLVLRRLRMLTDLDCIADSLDDLLLYRHDATAMLAAARPRYDSSGSAERVPLDGMVLLPCILREQRFLRNPADLVMVLTPEAVVFVEREAQLDGGAASKTGEGIYGVVRVFTPILRAHVAIDPKDDRVLHCTIASAAPVQGCSIYHKADIKENVPGSLGTWHLSVVFDSEAHCRQAKMHVDICRAEVRAFKLLKIEQVLNTHVQITHSHRASMDSPRGEVVSDR